MTTGHSDESFRLLALRDGADLPKCEFFSLDKFDGVSVSTKESLVLNIAEARKLKMTDRRSF